MHQFSPALIPFSCVIFDHYISGIGIISRLHELRGAIEAFYYAQPLHHCVWAYRLSLRCCSL